MNFEQMSLFENTENHIKKDKMKTIISASRRTDIPAFYYNWLQDVLEKGEVELQNPMFPAKNYKVDLKPDSVHSIVLWSKNFSSISKDPGRLSDYNLFFEYTINNYSKLLEPNVPEYSQTIKTLEALLKRYRPGQFNIRFDPVIITAQKGEKEPDTQHPQKARLKAFETLCRDISTLGMNSCRLTTSYISLYSHVKARLKKENIDIIYLNENEQLKFFEEMAGIADKYDIKLYSCANRLLEGVKGINPGHCIDGELLVSLFGGSVTSQKDKSQRAECGCTASRDIGSYSNGANGMKCLHKCIYCYVR